MWEVAGPFAAGLSDPPPFVVGESDPARDWPLYQPGPLDGRFGYREHAVEAVFRHDGEPHGHYELGLDVYARQGPCPHLRLELNGTAGWLYPAVERVDRSGTRFPHTPISGWARARVPLAAALLRRGRNRLRIVTTQDPPPDPVELRVRDGLFAGLFGSELQWGALRLGRAAERPTHALRLEILPLWRREPGGQIGHCTITVARPFASGRLRVALAGRGLLADVELEPAAFGEIRREILLPDRTQPLEARIDVTLDGDTVCASVPIPVRRKWTLHLVPLVHFDLGYTDHQGKILELHSRNLERALPLLEARGWAYTVDAAVVVDHFRETRPPGARARLERTAHAGRLAVNRLAFHPLTGIASLGEWRRVMGGREEDLLHVTDVPSLNGCLPTLLSAAGVRRFVAIVNHQRACTEDGDWVHLHSPFRWTAADGAEVDAFVADGYAQVRHLMADPPTVAGAIDALSRFIRRFERDDYPFADLPIVGIQLDNEDIGDPEIDFVERWNATFAHPQMRFGTFADYFDAIAGHELPVVRGDGGSFWEDGTGSAARLTARHRGTQALLPVAETLHALVARVAGRPAPVRRIGAAWDELLVGSEHTLVAHDTTERPWTEATVEQLWWVEQRAEHARLLARDLEREAMSALGELVACDAPAVLVFNPTAQPRTDEIRLELPAGRSVAERGGGILPDDRAARPDGTHAVRFTARDIPAFGYRTFPIVDGPGTTGPPPRSDTTVKVGSYRVEIDASEGRVARLRWGDVQLIDERSPFAFGAVLYVSGGGTAADRGLGWARTALADFDRSLPAPDLTITAGTMSYGGAHRRRDGIALRFAGHAGLVRHIRAELVLREDDDRVEYRVRLTKRATLAREAVYVAFPFALADPQVRYDRQVGWIDPPADHLPGAANEWFVHHRAVGLLGATHAIAWTAADAPLFTLGDVVRGRWPRAAQASATLLSWVMNNYWDTNHPAQQSVTELELRYAFTPLSAWDPAAASRLGLRWRRPTLCSLIQPHDKRASARGPLPADAGRLLELEAADGLLVDLAAADGLVAHVAELAGTAGELRLDGERHVIAPHAVQSIRLA
jgi:alpha-mannosidase